MTSSWNPGFINSSFSQSLRPKSTEEINGFSWRGHRPCWSVHCVQFVTFRLYDKGRNVRMKNLNQIMNKKMNHCITLHYITMCCDVKSLIFSMDCVWSVSLSFPLPVLHPSVFPLLVDSLLLHSPLLSPSPCPPPPSSLCLPTYAAWFYFDQQQQLFAFDSRLLNLLFS